MRSQRETPNLMESNMFSTRKSLRSSVRAQLTFSVEVAAMLWTLSLGMARLHSEKTRRVQGNIHFVIRLVGASTFVTLYVTTRAKLTGA